MRLIYFTNSVFSEEGLDNRKLKVFQAGNHRSRYIVEAIKKCNTITNIIFLSQAPGTAGGVQNQIERTQDKFPFKEVYIGYFGRGIIQWVTSVVSTTLWFLKNTNREDIVVVYNFLPRTAIPIIFSKFFRNYKLIVQFEELYGYMDYPYKPICWLLERFSLQSAIGFITPSHYIADILRKYRNNNARIVMSYGYPTIPILKHHFQQSPTRLQLIYSGNLDSERGVLNFINLLPYVTDFADLTITGKGPFSSLIEKLSQTHDNLKFLGFVSEDQYVNVLSEMHVCINPTPVDSNFAKYTFPSKVIFYISNSKIVLSTPLEVIKNSPYQKVIQFYEGSNPQSLRDSLLFIKENYQSLSERTRQFSAEIQKIQSKESEDISLLIDRLQ
ncbi:MAG: glycosyltransferase [Methanoregula sp.]